MHDLELTLSNEDLFHKKTCSWRLHKGGAAWNDWMKRCAGETVQNDSEIQCALQDIITMAWCNKDYQTVVNF